MVKVMNITLAPNATVVESSIKIAGIAEDLGSVGTFGAPNATGKIPNGLTNSWNVRNATTRIHKSRIMVRIQLYTAWIVICTGIGDNPRAGIASAQVTLHGEEVRNAMNAMERGLKSAIAAIVLMAWHVALIVVARDLMTFDFRQMSFIF